MSTSSSVPLPLESSSSPPPSLQELLLEKLKFTPPVSDLEPTSGLAKPSYAVKPSPTTKAPPRPPGMTLKTKLSAATASATLVDADVIIDITDQVFTTQDLDELLEFLLKIRHEMEVPF